MPAELTEVDLAFREMMAWWDAVLYLSSDHDFEEFKRQLKVGLPVWVAMKGLPAMPVQKGQIEFFDPRNPAIGVRILTEGVTPTGKYVYLQAQNGEFWPRSLEVDCYRPHIAAP